MLRYPDRVLSFRPLLAALALAPALLLPRAAAAQQAEEPERIHYGWQNFLAVGTSYTLIFTGVGTEQEWLAITGGAGYALSGPIIHAAHENWTSAGVSLGLNLGLPVGMGLLGMGLACAGDGCRDSFGLGGVIGILFGGVLGMITASVIDVAVLSYEDAPAPAGGAASALRARPAWVAPPITIGGRF